MEVNHYRNPASTLHPALVVFLIDGSSSMGRPMSGGVSRLDVALDCLECTFTEMIARSRMQEQILPRYLVALYVYSDDVYDVYDGIRSIDEITNIGIPSLHLMSRKANEAAGLYAVHQLLKKDVATWKENDLKFRPAPLLIHMTDGETLDSTGEAARFAKEIMQISTPDGHVLLENVFVTHDIRIPTNDLSEWAGSFPSDRTGNSYLDRLLQMSSVIPESYLERTNSISGTNLHRGTLMTYPAVPSDIVQHTFAITQVS